MKDCGLLTRGFCLLKFEALGVLIVRVIRFFIVPLIKTDPLGTALRKLTCGNDVSLIVTIAVDPARLKVKVSEPSSF